jgi:rhodanese-related sulfurtransferase
MSRSTLLYDQIARVGKALGAPVRVAILDVLSQAPATVEGLAQSIGQSVANTSQHLRVLREAGLVEGNRRGLFIPYRLAGDGVATCLVRLRELAESQLTELQVARQAISARAADVEHIDRETLFRRIKAGEAVLIDVRPPAEFNAGHLPGAISVPLEELEKRLRTLPRDREIIAYCRGPYCMLAVEAVRLLERRGRKARRYEDGVAEWRAAGLRVETGSSESTPSPNTKQRRPTRKAGSRRRTSA